VRTLQPQLSAGFKLRVDSSSQLGIDLFKSVHGVSSKALACRKWYSRDGRVYKDEDGHIARNTQATFCAARHYEDHNLIYCCYPKDVIHVKYMMLMLWSARGRPIAQESSWHNVRFVPLAVGK